jgi:hypothetical protein
MHRAILMVGLRDRETFLCSRLRFSEHNMDLNYLYHRQQVSLYCADNVACDRSRQAHRSMADAYAALISVAKNNDPARAW